MSLSRIEVDHVFFDAAGTLIRLKRSVGEIYSQLAVEHGFQAMEGDLSSRLETNFRRAFANSPPLTCGAVSEARRLKLERDWWRRIVNESFSDLGTFPDQEEFFSNIFERFAGAEFWKLTPGCLRTLSNLKRVGKGLGVISNFDSRLRAVLQALGILDRFQVICISSEAQAAKPDPRIFSAAVRRMGGRAGRCLHVGNHLKDDFQGARRAGLKAALFDPRDRFPGMDFPGRIRRLNSLMEILI
ncbi:MAG TPA: HAD-IA family hydrolase [Acidobacteriota bacterium]|nr:HAD-IA family hydrolase [Acidobacteriota bacterium]